jgi:hypothetical protein
MDFLTLIIPAILVLALCFLGMAVGIIFRNKSFKSCGCGSLTYRGERIDCPGHVPEGTSDDTANAAASGGCCRRPREGVEETAAEPAHSAR